MSESEKMEIEKWRYTKTKAISVLQRKAFDIIGDENPDMNEYNKLVDAVNVLKNMFSRDDMSTEEIVEFVNEHVTF